MSRDTLQVDRQVPPAGCRWHASIGYHANADGTWTVSVWLCRRDHTIETGRPWHRPHDVDQGPCRYRSRGRGADRGARRRDQPMSRTWSLESDQLADREQYSWLARQSVLDGIGDSRTLHPFPWETR